MRCPKCQQENLTNSEGCVRCGARLTEAEKALPLTNIGNVTVGDIAGSEGVAIGPGAKVVVVKEGGTLVLPAEPKPEATKRKPSAGRIGGVIALVGAVIVGALGINALNQRALTCNDNGQIPAGAVLTALYEPAAQQWWLGRAQQGLYVSDARLSTLSPLADARLGNISVRAIALSETEAIWAGTYAGQVFELEGQGVAQQMDVTSVGCALSAMLVAPERVYVGALDSHGLGYFDRHASNKLTVTAPPDLPMGVRLMIHALDMDTSGTVWVATQRGLYSYDRVNWALYSLPDSDSTFTQLTIDAMGNKWVALESGGLAVLQPQRAQAPPTWIGPETAALPNAQVTAMTVLPTRDGVLVGADGQLAQCRLSSSADSNIVCEAVPVATTLGHIYSLAFSPHGQEVLIGTEAGPLLTPFP